MNPEQHMGSFSIEGESFEVGYIETMEVTDGVKCEVYSFVEDGSRDLGIIHIEPGKRTPLQRVLSGDRTIEGYMSGKGRLIITGLDGAQQVYEANGGGTVCSCGQYWRDYAMASRRRVGINRF
ncbi:MAG: hypothetical protein WCG48_03945 [Candidatus Berkelbacteria bacterium]